MNQVSRISIALVSLFALLAVGACGGGSGSNRQPPPPPADTTAPTVSAVSGPAGSTVNRIVTLSVTASDNVGVTEVRFFVDNTQVGTDTTAPYSFDWDTATVADGDHVLRADAVDSAGNTGQSGDLTVTVRNVVQFAVSASGNEVVSPTSTTGTAQADITVNLVTGAIEGTLTVSDMTPTAAHIHDAFAGVNGPVLVSFTQDATDPSLFTIDAATTIDAVGIDRLLAGALYVNVHSAAVPEGEVRGQILPQEFVLRFTVLGEFETVPGTGSLATGRAAITLNESSGAVVVHVRVEELDDATQAHVHDAYAGATGPVLVSLTQDMADAGHWFAEDATLNDDGLASFAAGRLYVNVHSPDFPAGEVRGQILPEGIAVIFTELSGEQEVPVVDTTASGLAALTLDEAGMTVSLHVNTVDLDDAAAAALNNAFAGRNGPGEIILIQDGGNPAHWFAEDQAINAALLDLLLAGSTYVNVRSPANPSGEIRGQVIPDGILFALGQLEGRQEVPPVDSAAGGTYAITIDPDAMVFFAIVNTTGADDATASHIHDGYAGTNGSVVYPLSQDPGEISRWTASNAPLSVEQLAALRAGRYYVNVHTPANPPGEVRGQLAIDPVEVTFADLGGEQEVPPVVSAATGIAAITVNRDSGAITLHANTVGAATASAAHIHQGYAGQNGGVLIPLQQDPMDAAHWFVDGGLLDDAGLADYVAGRTYVNVHTPANPPGELRGQIAPPNIRILLSMMDGDQVVPPVITPAGGIVATTADLESRRFVAYVNADGVDDATSSGIHLAGIGTNGNEVLSLQQTPMQLGQWSAIAERLDSETFLSYRAGRLYAQVATPSNPQGELRGQIVPPDAILFDDQAPTVSLTSPGDPVSETVTLEADANDDQGVTEVRFLVDGALIGTDTTPPYSVNWDTTTVSNGQVTLTAEADDAAGNTGTSANVVVTVDNAVAVTLTQIQNEVFGPICSGCHSGPTSGNLPSGMNLTSATNSHAALNNVASIQRPAIDRVEPSDPDNSYLIHKLEGGPNIVGTRMPQGGPFLSQETIDKIRQWIADGAPNN